jgi:hypothetical protein
MKRRHLITGPLIATLLVAGGILVLPRLGASGQVQRGLDGSGAVVGQIAERGSSPTTGWNGPPPPAGAFGDQSPGSTSETRVTAPVPRAATAVEVVAAGDIACDPRSSQFNDGQGVGGWCRAKATAKLVARLDPDRVLALGDLQYDDGRLPAFRKSYDRSWGRFLDRTSPVVGNHEYWVPGAAGYFSYFGTRAGAPGQGWYSFDLGAWHLIGLNSNCDVIECRKGSAQWAWLRADLAASSASCTLAFFHHPRFSSGPHGDEPMVAPLWRLLRRGGVDVLLNGHDHIYERFRPLAPDGTYDARGVRAFTVGTGGAQRYWVEQVHRGSVVRNTRAFGVLRLSLREASYRWGFVPTPNRSFSDSGWSRCQGQPLS